MTAGLRWTNSWAGWLATAVFVVATVTLGLKAREVTTSPAVVAATPLTRVGMSYTLARSGESRLQCNCGSIGSWQINNPTQRTLQCTAETEHAVRLYVLRPGELLSADETLHNVRCQ